MQISEHTSIVDLIRHAPASNDAVLLVEDSTAERFKLKAILTDFGYSVHAVGSATEAISVLESEHIPIVVSDWMMPEMSGLELCREVRRDYRYGQPYVILVTGRTEPEHLIAGMDAGADDFLPKPVSKEELRVRVQAGARITRMRGTLERKNVELEASLEREAHTNALIKQDLVAAAQMQQHLLPAHEPILPSITTGGLFQPAIHVAGDGFGYVALDGTYLAFYQIDVSGHGIAAAMLSFTVSNLMNASLRGDDGLSISIDSAKEHEIPFNPATLTAHLNARFQNVDVQGHYFTMVCGVLNATTGAGRLCQAGHPSPLVLSKAGSCEALGSGGFPVGLLPDATYESVDFSMQHGDRLILYSDGVTDAVNDEDAPFTVERFRQCLNTHATESVTELVKSIDTSVADWRGGRATEDDISLLALEYVPQEDIKISRYQI